MPGKDGILNIGDNGVAVTDNPLKNLAVGLHHFDEIASDFLFDGNGSVAGGSQFADGLGLVLFWHSRFFGLEHILWQLDGSQNPDPPRRNWRGL